MKKYRRIEVHAYRRRVTVVSGAWRPDELFEPSPASTDDTVALKDTGGDEPVEPDSPEGQMILAEAVRTLEQRLSPEARALILKDRSGAALTRSPNTSFHFKLQSIFQLIWSKAFRFAR